MPTTVLPLADALAVVRGAGDAPQFWNPVYRMLADDAAGGTDSADSVTADPAVLDMLRRHVASPALIVLAVQQSSGVHRLRLALHPTTATVESSTGGSPSTWEELPAREAGRRLASLLPDSVRTARPDLAQDSAAQRLRPGPEQASQLAAALHGGAALAQAVTQLDDLDEDVRDLLLADDERISLTLSLRPTDPTGPSPGLARLWVRGERSLYRTDAPPRPIPEALPVPDGDVLATLLAMLQQGLEHAAAVEEAAG